MSGGSRWPPASGVPTLTEVVEDDLTDLPAPSPDDTRDGAAPAWQAGHEAPAGMPEPESTSERAEQQLIERVLGDVQRQISPLIEQRLRETLMPVLARWSDSLVDESREALAAVLRDVVEQAVAREFERQRRR